jgi:hypothetical protein
MEIADGVLCLPAGLDPERVRLLTSALRGEPFPTSDPAMMWFLGRAGVKKEVVTFIDCFIDDGVLHFTKGFERLTWSQRLKIGILGYQALGVFDLLRDYLVQRMKPRPKNVKTLEDAIVELRDRAAERLDCESDWDAILQPALATRLTELGREWNVAG